MTTGCDHPPHSSTTTGWTCLSQVTIFYSSKSHNHRPTYPSCGYLGTEDAHLRCHTHSPITTAEKRGPTRVGFSGVAAPRISIIQSAPIVSQAGSRPWACARIGIQMVFYWLLFCGN